LKAVPPLLAVDDKQMLRVRPAALLTEPACLGRKLDAPHVLVRLLNRSDTAEGHGEVAAVAGELDSLRETPEGSLEQLGPTPLDDRCLHAAHPAGCTVDQLEQVC
jgi:hypothetical protein